ncbi:MULTISPECIES: vWA domain-containing protein [unclassified Spirulina]|uniref:vWA domain-containing protein n=1 Tax=unclassified Spirulina TaxID=2684457 RepID=UPI00195278A3|nr:MULTISPECIES: VWA domain-containing protein [Spirulina]MEA5470381.1 VWA domain-containing protein [Spirulina sp. 06S082]
MLNVSITPHREFLPADSPEQKLFLMLKLRPTQDVASSRPSTAFAFVIDTSGSMYEVIAGNPQPTGRTFFSDGKEYNEVTGAKSKIDIVIESLQTLIHSGRLDGSDRVALIQFDDAASTILPLTSATQTTSIEEAIAQLRNFSGSTRMGLGLRHAFDLLATQQMTSRRILLFTDGATFDEDYCLELAPQFVTSNIPITVVGVGDYEEDLLIQLKDMTGGVAIHVDPDATPEGSAVLVTDLPNTIIQEFNRAQQDVINNLKMTVQTVKGVTLNRIVRAYPEQAEFSLTSDPYPIGNATANDETVFILEFNLDSRPAKRVRIAQLGLTYDVPGQNRRGELPPQNVVVQFVAGQMGAQVDQEVMGYVQQCNIGDMVKRATVLANSNPEQAEQLLQTAQKITQRLGNSSMTRSLGDARDELRKTRKISPERSKTIKMGAKGKTVRMGGDINDSISDEQIRKISGT